MKVDLVIVNTTGNDHFKKSLLRYFFRGINQYLSWVNNIYYIVNKDIQLPDWLDITKLKLIYVEDLVPTALSTKVSVETIELFLNNILGLAYNFIVLKDNTFIVAPMSISDFFHDTKNIWLPKLSLMPTCTKNFSGRLEKCLTTYDTLFSISSSLIWTPYYGIRVLNKDLLALTWQEYANIINDNFNKINSDIIYYTAQKYPKTIVETKNLCDSIFNYSTAWAGIIKYDLLYNKDRNYISITNDFLDIEGDLRLFPTAEKWIKEGLENRVGTALCKHELN